MVEDVLRVLHQGDPSDTRFQFEIIKGLSESIRDLAKGMRDVQSTQVNMLERLARLEANTVGETVGKLEERINILESDKDRRDGAGSFLGGMFKYGPTVFSLLTLLYLFGRSLGIVPSPPTTATIVNPPAILQPARDGTNPVGGKP